MNDVSAKTLRARAKKCVKNEGLVWADLMSTAKQIIVFGSHACGLQSFDSDLDLLCVGKGIAFKSPRLHVIWVPEERLTDEIWLGGELATHISKYGVWIKGRRPWRRALKPNKFAVAKKNMRIHARAHAITSSWNDLLPAFKAKQLRRLRRDIQRLLYLKRGAPMPPTKRLDMTWEKLPKSDRNWIYLINGDEALIETVVRVPSKPI